VATFWIQHARSVRAQNNSAETEQLQNEFAQLSAEVNAFLQRGNKLIAPSAAGAQLQESAKRQQLLRCLSSFENKISSNQSRALVNAIRDLEEKLFRSPAARFKPPTEDTSAAIMSKIKPSGTNSNQIQPDATGTVTGKITDTGANPIDGVTVFVVTQQGNGFGGITDSQGNYTVPTPPWTYYVVTNNNLGYLDQMYNGQPCLAFKCLDNPSNGTQITVTSGSTTANINFTLKKGGALTGKVIDAVSSAPLANLLVAVYDANGLQVEEYPTDSSGNYLTSGLPPGTYYTRVFGRNAYISQTYNGINCTGEFCNAAVGTPITVNTSFVSNINFALAKGGSITGVVTDAITALPIASIGVVIVDSAGNEIELLESNASGVYTTVEGLVPGTYYAESLSDGAYLDQLYNGIQCGKTVGCVITNGTPVTVTSGATTAGINFPLLKGGLISGKVTDAANAPLVDVEVDISDANGTVQSFGSTNASGNYTSEISLPAGTYFAQTVNSGFIDQLYNGIVCVGICDVTTGTPISVTLGSTTGNINFTLQAGGFISGKVVDANDNSPVNTNVQAFDGNGNLAGSGHTNNAGPYTMSGLPAGTYYVRTTNTASYIDQLYSGIQCAFQTCTPTTGTPVSVSAGTTTANINFALQKGGKISGTIINTANSVGISNVTVRIYDANGLLVTSPKTGFGGTYISNTGLPTGVYFARTSNELGYLDQLYSGLSCALSCRPSSGTPINVTAGSSTNNINFGLQKGGTISGKVTDAVSHGPIPNVFVNIYDPSGNLVTNGESDGAGNYVTFDGLPSGKYFAQSSNSQNYIDALFNGIQCPLLCDPTSGTAITVNTAANTANVDFALTKGGTITGKVTDANTSAGLSSVTVSIFDSTGTLVTSASTNGAGAYTTTKGLPAGNYFAKSGNSQGYLNQIYNGITCLLNSCAPTSGTPIAVSSGTTTSNINLALPKGGSITGKIIDAGNSQPLSGVTVRILDNSGSFVTTGTTNGSGIYTSTAGLPTGVYLAKTSNSLGYVEQLYQNIQCAGCSVTTGTSIPVVTGAQTTAIDFALSKGGTISGTVIDAVSHVPLESVSVTLYDGGGRAVSTGTSDASGKYVSGAGVPTGSYFAATSNDAGYLDELYNAIACPVGCAVTAGTPISINAGSNTANINFALPQAGSAIQFSSSSFTVSEASTSATITVQRLGDLNGTASVDFSTSDGTAAQKSDYTPAFGTLNFATGESIKTFQVPLTKDAFQEGNETVNLSLSNVTGAAVLGNPNQAVLTITNDPLAPASPNPIDDTRDFVIQHYHDFLGRDADDAGLVFWANAINSCGADAACVAVNRINTSAAFFMSIEFQETGGAVIRLQRAAFGKKSNDPATRITYQQLIRDSRQIGNGVIVGQGAWDQLLNQNKQAYAQQVVTSPAFIAGYPISLSAANFVDALFASAGVTPTSAERQAAINAFAGGGTSGRTAALLSVTDSSSLRQIELTPSFVLMQYFGYLRRNPTDAPDNNDNGYQFWLTKLNSLNGDFNKAEMVKAFILSNEYRSRFGSP
jgi:hypothetical protein